MDEEKAGWLAFGYKMAHLPSRCRVYVWRKLERVGAIRYQQGVVFLPRSERFIQVVTELKEDIVRFGGEASIADVRFLDPKDENALVKKFNDNIQCAYKEVERILTNLSEEEEKICATGKTTQSFLEEKRMTLKKHKKSLEDILKRDHFQTGYSQPAVRRVTSLSHTIETSMLKAGRESV